MTKERAINKAVDILAENDLFGEVCGVYNIPAIEVHIRGDWKHDHARCDYVMEQNGYTLLKKEVTEEDGSDWYTAIHYYGYKAW